MKDEVSPTISRVTGQRQQTLLVRAVVGSLVLCAALAPSSAAQSVSSVAPQGGSLEEIALQAKQLCQVDVEPLREWLTKLKAAIATGKIDSSAIDLTIEAADIREGRTHLTEVGFAGAEQKRWLESNLAQDFVSALNRTGALRHLEDVRHLRLTLKADQHTAWVQAAAVYNWEGRAAQLAKNYNNTLALMRSLKPDEETSVVLNNMTVSANGKQLLMRLEMPREAIGNLLRKHLSLP